MFCSKCGTQLNDDAKFCKECGAKTAAGKAEAAGAPRAAAAPKAAPSAAPRSTARRRPAPQTAFADESAGRTRIVLAVVGVLALAAVGFFLWKSGDKGPKPSAPTPVVGGAAGGAPTKGIAEIDRVPSGLDISGSISLGPGISAPSSGALYVMARPAATPDQRSPLAVDKVNPSPGKTAFVIGPDNLMTGGSFDQPVVLTVRWDQDGDPLTKQIGDLTGAAGPFKPGDTNAAIVLDKKLEKAELHPGLIDGSVPEAIAAIDGNGPAAPAEGAASAPAEPAEGEAGAPADGAAAPAEGAASAPAEEAKAGASPTKITGRILLGEGVKAPSDGIIFIIARNPGVAAGPPVAAARITPGAQGLTYAIGPEHVMMGGPFKGPYDITARWDRDGNAMSKQPGDLSGAAKAPASAGQSADIVLDTVKK
jgi:hypothetical protein